MCAPRLGQSMCNLYMRRRKLADKLGMKGEARKKTKMVYSDVFPAFKLVLV